MAEKTLFALVCSLLMFLNSYAFADSIVLKSGQKIVGKIVERNEDSVKIQYEGVDLTYYKSDILKIESDGDLSSPKIAAPTASEDAGDKSGGNEKLKFYLDKVDSKKFDAVSKEDRLTSIEFLKSRVASGDVTLETYLGLGVNYYFTNSFEDALLNLKKAVSLAPNDPRVHSFLGLTYKALGRQDEANKEYVKFVEILLAAAKTTQEYNRAWILRKMME